MNSTKMITIKNKELSEETVVKALKEYGLTFEPPLPDIKGIELVADKNEIVEYVREHPIAYPGYKVYFTRYRNKILLAVPLPTANSDWTFAAFDYVKDFCGAMKNIHVYPVHSRLTPDNKNLYIKVDSLRIGS